MPIQCLRLFCNKCTLGFIFVYNFLKCGCLGGVVKQTSVSFEEHGATRLNLDKPSFKDALML